MRSLALAFSIAMAAALSSGAHAAEQAGDAPASSDATAKKPELTAEEKAEKEIRRACKIKVCGVLESKDPAGEDINCDIVRTWREEEIAKAVEKRINWPWGKARCEAQILLKREPLAKAMSEADFEVALPTQKIRCALNQKAAGEPYKVEIALAPKVKFANGKATEAKLNWGKVSAPMMIYPLLYAATGLDNANNVLGPEIVRMVNEFTTKKCAELNREPSAPKPD
jgi:hypothetical protein